MLLDNPGVLCEQRVCGDNYFWPGDLYYSDFYQGHLAFFDIFVCNTHAFVSAGTATATGRALKDKYHENNVVTAGDCSSLKL